MHNLGKISAVLLVALLMSSPIGNSICRAGRPSGGSEGHVMSWAELYGNAVVLRAGSVMPEAGVTVKAGPADLGGWFGKKENEIMGVEFRRKGTRKGSLLYLLAPWQRLKWKGTGVGHPGIVTVTRHLVVLGPIISDDYRAGGRDFLERSRSLIEDLIMKDLCEMGTRVGPLPSASTTAVGRGPAGDSSTCLFRPYYIRISYAGNKVRTLGARGTYSWGELVERRMLLVTRVKNDPKAPGEVVTYDFYPPKRVNRTRPFPPDPAEQRLSPDIDLKTEGKKLDRALRSVFGDALTKVLSDKDRAGTGSFNMDVYNSMLKRLEHAVFSYAGHTGPGYAAGATAFEEEKSRLKGLLIDNILPDCERGYWPASPVAFRPGLLESLRVLPTATAGSLPALFNEFDRLRRIVEGKGRKDHIPSDDELLLAEVGDRIRTVLEREPASVLKKVLKGEVLESMPLHYKGYELRIEDPLRSHVPRFRGPVMIKIDLHRE